MEDVLKLIQPRPCLQVGSQKVVGTGFRERLQHQEGRSSRQAVGKELADPLSKTAGFLKDGAWVSRIVDGSQGILLVKPGHL